MSKRSSDALGSMDIDQEGEGAAKQQRTKQWQCGRCKKEIDNDYYIRWWTDWVLNYFCTECSRKEAEEADKKAAEEKATKEKKEDASMDSA